MLLLAGAEIDGRLARSARARTAVVDALLDLIEEGVLRPTAPRIAERAGVSLRLVFHHFRDLERLFGAASSWSTWQALRAHQRLSRPRATRVLTRMLTALLQEEP